MHVCVFSLFLVFLSPCVDYVLRCCAWQGRGHQESEDDFQPWLALALEIKALADRAENESIQSVSVRGRERDIHIYPKRVRSQICFLTIKLG